MIPDLVNKFRFLHGVDKIEYWDNSISSYCNQHCWAMARAGNIYHAESYYLNDWKEAVASINYDDKWEDRIIFDILGAEEQHKRFLLECKVMAYAYCFNNWKVYLTIRGK